MHKNFSKNLELASSSSIILLNKKISIIPDTHKIAQNKQNYLRIQLAFFLQTIV